VGEIWWDITLIEGPLVAFVARGVGLGGFKLEGLYAKRVVAQKAKCKSKSHYD
jgi:hypothetical protein